ncbi:unnamed protein product, partial [Meganyctiphanes norvegica]
KKKEDSTGMEVDISAEEFNAGPKDDSTLKDRFSLNKTWNRDSNRGRRGDHRGGGGGGRGGRDRSRDSRGGGRGRGRGDRGGDRRGGGRGGDRRGGSRGGDHRGGGRGGKDNNINRFDESKFGKSYQHKILPMKKEKVNSLGQTKRESDQSEHQSKFLKPDEFTSI